MTDKMSSHVLRGGIAPRPIRITLLTVLEVLMEQLLVSNR